jgi:16S rRNA (adenine1518-N6/adenine1519-N6)-dimethyltransferase
VSPLRRGARAEGVLSRLRAAGLAPRRSLGQHFLHDPGLLETLVEAADLRPEEAVFEVGTGPGTLTALLARRARRVLTVEIDPRLAEFAGGELRDLDNVEILVGDVLERKSRLRASVAARLRDLGDFRWVSNLPYSIATPLVLAFLEGGFSWRRAVLTLQAEVANRLAALPGTAAYGPSTALLGFWADARRLTSISAGSFWPRPGVESAVLLLDPRAARPDAALWPAYKGWVKLLFGSRRKQLGARLRKAVGEAAAAAFLEGAGWPGERRGESLSREEFLVLASIFPDVFR